MSSFPLWQVSPVQSQRIKGRQIFFGTAASMLLLPCMFVILAAVLNQMIESGYAVPEFVLELLFLASQSLPYGLIGILATIPFSFAARRTGHIGLLPLLILSQSIFLMLSAALWIARLISFDPLSFLGLIIVVLIFGTTQWMVLRLACRSGFKRYRPVR